MDSLKAAGISHKVDDHRGIGGRYSRTDEIGIPYGITVNFDTIKTNTATLRERNTTKQVRLEVKTRVSLFLFLMHTLCHKLLKSYYGICSNKITTSAAMAITIYYYIIYCHIQIEETVRGLVTGHMTWEDVLDKYPLFTGHESTQQS